MSRPDYEISAGESPDPTDQEVFVGAMKRPLFELLAIISEGKNIVKSCPGIKQCECAM